MLLLFLFCLIQSTISKMGGLQIYEGPTDRSEETYSQWFNGFKSYRDEVRQTLDLSMYDVPEIQWARTSFIQPQVMVHDRFLYDRDSGNWTVKKYLADVRSRYGGIDSVLLWASYPNIGTDDRNQFDMLEDIPGGLEELRNVVNDFHEEGVEVLLPYNPWDQGTRFGFETFNSPSSLNMTFRNVGIPDHEKLVDQIVQSGSDGFNGDTLDGVNQTFWEEGLLRDHPIVIEPEVLATNFSYLAYNAMSWNYWTPGAKVLGDLDQNRDYVTPYVSLYKAVTDGKHLTHLTER